jgi:hypothetical protein
MTEASVQRQVGEGPLSRAAALVYTLLVVEGLLLVTALPGAVPLLLLDRDPSNVPLAALCAVPFGPALSAAVYALQRRRLDLTELRPAVAFFRGYRLNVGGGLRIWLPALAWLAVVGVSLANFSTAGVPGWWAGLLAGIAVVTLLWAANALVITSLFTFRTVDVARLGVYFLVRNPRGTFGNAGLLVLAAAVTYFATEALVVLLGAVLALALLGNSQPMIKEIREKFVA